MQPATYGDGVVTWLRTQPGRAQRRLSPKCFISMAAMSLVSTFQRERVSCSVLNNSDDDGFSEQKLV